MKIRLVCIATLVLALAGCKDNSIKISGKIDKQVEGEYLYLQSLKTNTLQTIDSLVLSEDGRFSFETETESPAFYLLKTSNENFLTLVGNPGDRISIEAKYNELGTPVNFKGSDESQKMLDYNKALKNTIEKISGLNEIYNQNADSPELPKVIAMLDSTAQAYLKDFNTYTRKYIDQNLNSLVSLVALYQQIAPRVYVLNPAEDPEDLKYYKKVDSALFKLYPEYEPVKSLHEQVQEINEMFEAEKGVTAAGGTIPEIELPDPNGKMIKLSSTRGKVVLLDFWAAWCPPCRRENPNLVAAYNKYNQKGFEIFQVSLDKTKEDWVKGIEDDRLGRWLHVSDLKYWNSSVVSQFNIRSIPYNMLLDRNGNVIASNLRGEALEKKLEEVMKQ